MKWLKLLPIIIFVLSALESVAQLKAGTIRVRRAYVPDSIVYEEEAAPVAAIHADYLDSIAGSWDVVTLKRQPGREAEYLVNAFIVINKDSTFTGNTGCNTFTGKFSLKGSSIRFSNVAITSDKECTFREQESLYLKLLQSNISKFTVDKESLWLRDGSSNIVFEATKK